MLMPAVRLLSKTSGNVEIIARVASQTSVTGNDFAGVMIRDTLAVGSPMVCMGVEPANGAHFISRYYSGNYANDVAGPSVTAPSWVRVTYNTSSQQVQGYQSNDGMSWTLVSSNFANLSPSFYIGFAVTSASTGNLSTATFDNLSYLANVPQTSGSMAPTLWLRSDVGVTASGGNVSAWTDQSGYANNAAQTASGNQPTITAGAINGVAALDFNGSSQYLNLNPGLAFGQGITAYVIIEPNDLTTNGRFIELNNSDGSGMLAFRQNASNGAAFDLAGYSGPETFVASTALTQSIWQALCVDLGPPLDYQISMYTNGILDASSSILNSGYFYRSNNYIGTAYGAANNFYNGRVAEIVMLPTNLSDLQRISFDAYFYGKYGIGSQPVLPPVTISPGTGVVSQATTLTMSDVPGAIIRYTVDGTDPDPTGSPIYSAAIPATSTTYKAIAVMPFATTSAVSTAVIKIDPSAVSVPRTGLLAWLMADYAVTANGSNQVSQWFDMSGNGSTFAQSSTANMPVLKSGLLNDWPAIQFDGSTSYLQAGPGFSTPADQINILAVATPSTFTSNSRYLDCGTGAANENFILRQDGSTGGIGFDTYNGTSGSSIATASGASILKRGQLIEACLDGTHAGTILSNGSVLLSGAMNALNNVTRSGNYLGTNYGASGNFLNGSISEILVYSSSLIDAQRQGAEQYLIQKYQLLTPVQAPIFSPPSGTTFATDSQIAIIATPECETRFTVDGSEPSNLSPLYVGPIMVNVSSLTVKAINIRPGFPNSAVQTATYTVTSP